MKLLASFSLCVCVCSSCGEPVKVGRLAVAVAVVGQINASNGCQARWETVQIAIGGLADFRQLSKKQQQATEELHLEKEGGEIVAAERSPRVPVSK